jgi:outer membrane protein
MLARVPLVWMRAVSRRALWIVLFCLAAGCAQPRSRATEGLAKRVLPPPDVLAAATLDKPELLAGPTISGAQKSGEVQWKAAKSLSDSNAPPPCVPLDGKPSQPLALPDAPPPRVPLDSMPCPPLTLPDAIALAFRSQPRLRASLESIQQARGKEGIAFAAFLPTLTSGYTVGSFDLNVGGGGSSAPNSSPFAFSPATGAVPSGLNIKSGFELAELKLQLLVCDFGRRLGSYNQAGLATEISQLQTERAYQTVANDVATAYYQVLRSQSLYSIAKESVRRAEDDLDVAKKLAKGGVVEREKVLRAEVALAQAQRALDLAEEAEAVAVATLNLAIGINVSACTTVVDSTDVPPFTRCLADCLQEAVSVRREFWIARQSVQAAQKGSRVARADFAPRIVAEGDLLPFQQGNPRLHTDLTLGSVKLEWGLFEGGKRVAELRVADSRTREAMAQADSIADTIAFQVTQAYRQLVTAHKGIERSRPAVDLARETYRLVVARSREGDATPAELTDAEASLTRSEQDYANSVYDYLTAVNRLEYAMGTTATP